MNQRFKSFVVNQIARSLNWVSDNVSYKDPEHGIGWKDHLRWFAEGILDEIFHWAYQGSDEELLSVDNDEIPVEYMSPRQFDYYNRFALTIIPGGAA